MTNTHLCCCRIATTWANADPDGSWDIPFFGRGRIGCTSTRRIAWGEAAAFPSSELREIRRLLETREQDLLDAWNAYSLVNDLPTPPTDPKVSSNGSRCGRQRRRAPAGSGLQAVQVLRPQGEALRPGRIVVPLSPARDRLAALDAGRAASGDFRDPWALQYPSHGDV